MGDYSFCWVAAMAYCCNMESIVILDNVVGGLGCPTSCHPTFATLVYSLIRSSRVIFILLFYGSFKSFQGGYDMQVYIANEQANARMEHHHFPFHEVVNLQI